MSNCAALQTSGCCMPPDVIVRGSTGCSGDKDLATGHLVERRADPRARSAGTQPSATNTFEVVANRNGASVCSNPCTERFLAGNQEIGMRLLDLCEFFVDCGDLFFERCDLFRVIREASRAVPFSSGIVTDWNCASCSCRSTPARFFSVDHDKDKRAILALYHLHLVRDGNGHLAVHISRGIRRNAGTPAKEQIHRDTP